MRQSKPRSVFLSLFYLLVILIVIGVNAMFSGTYFIFLNRKMSIKMIVHKNLTIYFLYFMHLERITLSNIYNGIFMLWIIVTFKLKFTVVNLKFRKFRLSDFPYQWNVLIRIISEVLFWLLRFLIKWCKLSILFVDKNY